MKLFLRRQNPAREHAAGIVGRKFAQASAQQSVLGESRDESGLAVHVGRNRAVDRLVQSLNRFVVHALILLLWAAPAFAQQPHADLVGSIKASLQEKGISLSDSCGAFQITKRVAWQLRAEGAGTLDKPSGNQCEGRAVDIIVYPDGHAFDILTDAGGSNGPAWSPIAPVDGSRWRAAVDPGDGAPPSGPPVPPPVNQPAPPVSVPVASLDLSPILARLQQIWDQNERIYADSNNRRDAQTTQILAAVNEPAFVTKVLSNRYVQLALAGIGTYYMTKAASR